MREKQHHTSLDLVGSLRSSKGHSKQHLEFRGPRCCREQREEGQDRPRGEGECASRALGFGLGKKKAERRSLLPSLAVIAPCDSGCIQQSVNGRRRPTPLPASSSPDRQPRATGQLPGHLCAPSSASRALTLGSPVSAPQTLGPSDF